MKTTLLQPFTGNEKLPSGNESEQVTRRIPPRVIVVGEDFQASIALAVAEAWAVRMLYGSAFVTVARDEITVGPEDPRSVIVVDGSLPAPDMQALKDALRECNVVISGEDYQIPPFRGHAGLSKIKRKAQWKDETYGQDFRQISRGQYRGVRR